MYHLPNDPDILVSSINFLLRDEIFKDLDAICDNYGIARADLEAKLARSGYHFRPELNCFK